MVKYGAMAHRTCEIMWLKTLIVNLGFRQLVEWGIDYALSQNLTMISVLHLIIPFVPPWCIIERTVHITSIKPSTKIRFTCYLSSYYLHARNLIFCEQTKHRGGLSLNSCVAKKNSICTPIPPLEQLADAFTRQFHLEFAHFCLTN